MAVKSKQLLSNLKESMENVAEMIALVLVCTDINVKKVFDRRVALSTLINFIEKHAAFRSDPECEHCCRNNISTRS